MIYTFISIAFDLQNPMHLPIYIDSFWLPLRSFFSQYDCCQLLLIQTTFQHIEMVNQNSDGIFSLRRIVSFKKIILLVHFILFFAFKKIQQLARRSCLHCEVPSYLLMIVVISALNRIYDLDRDLGQWRLRINSRWPSGAILKISNFQEKN